MEHFSKAAQVGPEYILSNEGGILITVSATHEDVAVKHAFKDCGYSRQRITAMQAQLDAEHAIHVSVCITAHKGPERGTAYLGSCWDRDLYTLINGGVHGYLPQMLEEARDELEA